MKNYIAKYSGRAIREGTGYSLCRSDHEVDVRNEQHFSAFSDRRAKTAAKGVVKYHAAKSIGLPDSSGLKLESLVRVIPLSDN